MTFTKDDKDLRNLADKVIKTYPNLDNLKNYKNQVRIGYQWSTKEKKNKGRITFGDCTIVNDKFKEFIDYDFIITFYVNAHNISAKAREMLMYHELRHIGIYEKDIGELKFYLEPHTIEDFEDIIEKHGMHWEEKL